MFKYLRLRSCIVEGCILIDNNILQLLCHHYILYGVLFLLIDNQYNYKYIFMNYFIS